VVAVQECREEAGVKCAAVGSAFERYDRPGVAFVFCRVLGTPTVKYNNEFSDMGFFSIREMREMKLYHNVMELVRHCW
jgi:8-oxo-dGTP pyrophosphatase MutT (NUDIX family)